MFESRCEVTKGRGSATSVNPVVARVRVVRSKESADISRLERRERKGSLRRTGLPLPFRQVRTLRQSIGFITAAVYPCDLEFQSLRNKNKERVW